MYFANIIIGNTDTLRLPRLKLNRNIMNNGLSDRYPPSHPMYPAYNRFHPYNSNTSK